MEDREMVSDGDGRGGREQGSVTNEGRAASNVSNVQGATDNESEINRN